MSFDNNCEPKILKCHACLFSCCLAIVMSCQILGTGLTTYFSCVGSNAIVCHAVIDHMSNVSPLGMLVNFCLDSKVVVCR